LLSGTPNEAQQRHAENSPSDESIRVRFHKSQCSSIRRDERVRTNKDAHFPKPFNSWCNKSGFIAPSPIAAQARSALAFQLRLSSTTIEFDFGAEIAVIDCFSNGPQIEERLYILDVVRRNDSLLFRHSTKPL